MATTARTPEHRPIMRGGGITQAQKQALIDNLQLEITERARKLRAQYALQAQGLRARLEMRVNRIPQALRKRNIQALVEEHHTKSRPPPPPMPVATKTQASRAAQPAQARSRQSPKRKSNEISTNGDKENLPAQSSQELANPKKRTKTGVATANSKAARTRNTGPAGVLSPKSHNSRTLPHSPIKQAEKPASTKPVLAVQVAVMAKPTRAASRQAKRPGTMASEIEGRTSEASNTSAGTTIITKASIRKAALPKKSAPTKVVTGGRKLATAVPKAETVQPAATTRTLRKRNQ